jgi:Skp family chaperone for outer membrane proteins
MAIDKLRSELRIGFDGVSSRFGQVQARFNALEARLDTLEKRLAATEDRIEDEGRTTRRHIDIVAEEFKHYRQVLALEEEAARREERITAATGA